MAAGFFLVALVATGALGRHLPADTLGAVAALGLGALGVILIAIAPRRPPVIEPPRAVRPPPPSQPGERAEAD